MADFERCRDTLDERRSYGRHDWRVQTYDTLIDFLRLEVEDVLLGTEVGLVACLDFENEPFDERTTVACFRVRIRVPRLLLDLHRIGRQNGFEPRR